MKPKTKRYLPIVVFTEYQTLSSLKVSPVRIPYQAFVLTFFLINGIDRAEKSKPVKKNTNKLVWIESIIKFIIIHSIYQKGLKN